MKKVRSVGFLLFALAGEATAQIVVGPAVFTPASPRDVDLIRAEFGTPGGCGEQSTTTVTGMTIRTTVSVNLSGCIIGPPSYIAPALAFFGPLSAGTYTYELYEIDLSSPTQAPRFVSRQRLVVAASSIPTLSPGILPLLMLALVGVAWFALRK